MILVCGTVSDVVTELLCARLNRLGYPYRLLNLAFYPERYDVAWTWERGGIAGRISGPEWRIDIADLSGVFVRYAAEGVHRPATAVPAELERAGEAERHAGLSALWEHLACPIVNRMTGGFSNHSKPYQLLAIREAGLGVPRTLMTSDPLSALAFYNECGQRVIFKSLSGVRSIVRCLEPADLDRLAHLRHGPAQFQAYVPGCNVRVHTVDTAVFATRVHSAAVDYRYAERQGATIDMEPTTLPPAVARACLRLAREMRLTVAGIDLKETPDGDWYCFEVNPLPAFAYYEQHTGQPISAAIAHVLQSGREAQVGEEGDGVWNERRHREATAQESSRNTSPTEPEEVIHGR